MVSVRDVEEAGRRIAGRVRHTPVATVEAAAFGTPVPVTLKLELFQHTGSFKVRGAFNRMLAAAARAEVPRVVAASGGNHGLAVAYAARALGMPAEVFVPETIAPVKVTKLRTFGAAVTVTGRYYADAYEASARRAAETGALVVHAYDHPEVVAGQGTVGQELADQAPDLDTVLVAVGGGGLLAGIVTALDGRARVVAVEPDRVPTLHRALAAGGPVEVEVGGLTADSLGARRIGELAYRVAAGARVRSLLVTEDAVVAARQRLWDELHVAAEHGGAAALAALTSGAYRPAAGERVGVVVCGSNTDPADLIRR
jgi:threonine dehydratase